jgi:hypothetical protein
MLQAHEKRKAEVAAFRAAVAAALDERDQEARDIIAAYEKAKKRAIRQVAESPDDMEDAVSPDYALSEGGAPAVNATAVKMSSA